MIELGKYNLWGHLQVVQVPVNESLIDVNCQIFAEADEDTVYMPSEELVPWERDSGWTLLTGVERK